MSHRLTSKTALITGASRGQGETEARLFADEGAVVYLADVLDDEGEAVAADLRAAGMDASYLHLDVSRHEDWAAASAAIGDRGHAVDVLVNNAGIAGRGGALMTDLETWEKVFAVNVTGPLLGIKTFAPGMKAAGRGSIVNIASIGALNGYPNVSYAASKWALRGLSKSVALELAGSGVRVNAVHPGLILTPMNDDPEHNRWMIEMTPMGREGETSEIADLVLFLASDESTYITGADIAIDGGFSAGADALYGVFGPGAAAGSHP
jgi:NAD(P)-dependent dehydrogenase (short-subunit alcohol dehydrogenase family)